MLKMLRLFLVICLSILGQASVLYPVHASTIKPVDLAHSCIKLKSDSDHFDDVPIIMIHGMNSNKESWNGINEVLALETGKRVCIVDLRNHGESPWTDEVDTATMAEDIRHLLDKLNVPKAVVLGHSMGGKIAVHFALSYPERVDKLIIEDMRPNTMTAVLLEELIEYANLFKDVHKLIPQGVSEKEAREIFLKNLNEFLAKSNSSWTFDDPDSFPIKCKDGNCRYFTNTKIYQKLAEDVDSVFPESSGRYDGPALFIYGTESHLKVDEDESNIKKLFPNAELFGVNGADHMVHLFPEFKTEVIKFINKKKGV